MSCLLVISGQNTCIVISQQYMVNKKSNGVTPMYM